MIVWNMATRKLTPHPPGTPRRFEPSRSRRRQDAGLVQRRPDDQDLGDGSWSESIELPVQTMPVKCLAFAPDGKTLATAAADNPPSEITFWEAGSVRIRRVVKPRDFFWSMAFSPDAKTLAGAGMFRALKLIDVATGEVRASLPLENNASPVAFSPDGKLLATALHTGEVLVWDVTSSRRKWTLAEHKGLVFRIDFAPGRQVARQRLRGRYRQDLGPADNSSRTRISVSGARLVSCQPEQLDTRL